MTVAYTIEETEYAGKLCKKIISVTYESGDTSLALVTGLSVIKMVNCSPPSVATKYVTAYSISGGTLTITVTDPATDATLLVEVQGYI